MDSHLCIQEEHTLRQLTFKCKITKIVLVMSLKYTPVTQSLMYLDLFNVSSTHAPLNYSGQESKINLVYDSDIPVTLK